MMIADAAQPSKLRFTEERVLPYLHDQVDTLVQMAWFEYTAAIYRWMAPQCREQNVVDVGVGVGYGMALLEQEARRIWGVDIAHDAVKFAATRYPTISGHLVVGDALRLPVPSQQVDVICAVEVIEHVTCAPTLLAEFTRVLRPGGYCMLSTPNRSVFSPGMAQPWHPFHTREYSADELEALLRRSFRSVEMHAIVFTHRVFKARYLRAALEYTLPFPFAHLERFVYWHIPPWNRLPLGRRHVRIVRGALPHCAGLLAVCRDPIV